MTERTRPGSAIFPESVRNKDAPTQPYKWNSDEEHKKGRDFDLNSSGITSNSGITANDYGATKKVDQTEKAGSPTVFGKINQSGSTFEWDLNGDGAFEGNAERYAYLPYESSRSRSVFAEYYVDSYFKNTEIYLAKSASYLITGDSVSESHTGTSNSYSYTEHDWSVSETKNSYSKSTIVDSQSDSTITNSISDSTITNSISDTKITESYSHTDTKNQYSIDIKEKNYSKSNVKNSFSVTDTTNFGVSINHKYNNTSIDTAKAIDKSYSAATMSVGYSGKGIGLSSNATLINSSHTVGLFSLNASEVLASYNFSAGPQYSVTLNNQYSHVASSTQTIDDSYSVFAGSSIRLFAADINEIATNVPTVAGLMIGAFLTTIVGIVAALGYSIHEDELTEFIPSKDLQKMVKDRYNHDFEKNTDELLLTSILTVSVDVIFKIFALGVGTAKFASSMREIDPNKEFHAGMIDIGKSQLEISVGMIKPKNAVEGNQHQPEQKPSVSVANSKVDTKSPAPIIRLINPKPPVSKEEEIVEEEEIYSPHSKTRKS